MVISDVILYLALMSIEMLEKHLRGHLEFEPRVLRKIVSKFQEKRLAKKEHFVHAGQIPNYEGYITKGLVRQYVLDESGKESTMYFAVADWWVSDIDGFLYQKPATTYIQALEDSELLVISKEDKAALFEEFLEMEKLFRIMTQKSHAALQQRMVANLIKTAEERYVDYITKYPHIAKRLTNVQLASYLGISHEFLSKIKSKQVR